MNIAVELDNVICTPIRNFVALNDVSQCEVLVEAKESIQKLKSLGHIITIYTSREVSLRPDTELWLQRNKIPYDHLVFNKPQYDIFVDKKNYKFVGWEKFLQDNKYRIENS